METVTISHNKFFRICCKTLREGVSIYIKSAIMFLISYQKIM